MQMSFGALFLDCLYSFVLVPPELVDAFLVVRAAIWNVFADVNGARFSDCVKQHDEQIVKMMQQATLLSMIVKVAT